MAVLLQDLINEAYTNWNTAEALGPIGMELEARTRLPLARLFLRRALELDAFNHPEWYLSLAFACFRDVAGGADEGELAMNEGIEQTDSDFLKAAYLAFYEEEVPEEAIDALRTSDISAQFALVQSLLWRGRGDDALFLAREAIRNLEEGTLPLGIDLYCGAMNWMAAQGIPVDTDKEILPYLEQLIKAYPRRYQPHALLIQLYQTKGDWQSVYEKALETLALFPDEETTMLAAGIACERLERFAEAILWYNRAIGAKPSYTRARLRLARAYSAAGETDLAIMLLREIPEAFPEHNVGAIEAAIALDALGDSSGIALFSKALAKLKPYEKGPLEQRADFRNMLAKSQGNDLTPDALKV